ncbi:exodeoxyribonuclease VII large subunit, partial [Aeromonas caviae]
VFAVDPVLAYHGVGHEQTALFIVAYLHLVLDTVIGKRRHQLAEERLHALIAKRQDLARHRLAMLGARLDGISPLATLGRGYAIVRTPSGEVIRRASQVNAGQTLITTLAEGALRVRVDEVDNR